MLSYGMLVLTTAALAGIQTCQGTEGGHCPRNDCSLQATANRSQVECWITEKSCYAFSLQKSLYPPKPENLQVNVYRTANKLFEFNITWQPGSNENINRLRGYEITIEEKLGEGNKVCFEMMFNNTLQKLDPQTDGQLMLYSDCASGFAEGILRGHEYMIKVQSLPFPLSNDHTFISDDSVFIGYCDVFSVINGTVEPQWNDFYLNNEVVEVRCKNGHKLIGASALKCLSEGGRGNWNDKVPECIEYHVEVEVFLNQSALVKFFLPDCPDGHFVRLKDLTHNTAPVDKVKFVETGYTVTYENLSIGRWKAVVNACVNSREVEYQSAEFNIIGPTTTKTTTAAAATTTATTAAATETPSTPFYSTKLSPPTNVKNPLKNPSTYVFSVVGCVVGLLLVFLVFRLRSSYKRGTSHTDLQEESQNTESSMIVGNVCLTPDLPLNCSHNDAFTICSQSLIGVETGIRPSGSV